MVNSKRKQLSLPQYLTLGFVAIIAIGSILLTLPIASRSGNFTHYFDALFTATSATCVTGLTTVQTATHWSLFGEIVIMILVELGGLGFMTFTVLLFAMVRRRPTLTTRALVKESLNLESLADVKTVTQYVIGLSVVIQVIGMLLLMVDFVPRFGWEKGTYYSLFHSISSFCNAGFDLFGDSITRFANDPYVVIVLAMLIIAGGFGFLVWRDLLLRKKNHAFSLHTKISIATSSVLVVGGSIVFWFSESGFKILGNKVDIWSRIVDTIFLAITPRTAGLSMISYNDISMAGLILTMILMYIGGTPGSTAGGIKTTTVGILFLQSMASLRGCEDVEFGHRRFTQENIHRATMIVFVSGIILVAAMMILSVTETIPKNAGVEYVAFEVLSAFGTAGMSLGLTAHLTVIGKIVIMILMFIGRVGLFTVMYTILKTDKRQQHYRYVEESVLV